MDTSSIVPTRSLQKVFTPILSQITELIIVTSEHYESECTDGEESITLLRPLVSMAEDIVESLKDLTTVCQQTVTLQYADDKVVKQEVECSSQNLLVSGESLVLCCHILCSATKPNFQLKTPVPHQNDVAGCLSDLAQCMFLLLLSIDDAEVRKIANYGIAASDGLASLAITDTMQSLNDQFRSFANPAANLHISATARCRDMIDEKFQYKLRCALATLRQSLPMLAAALQMAIKYPKNNEVLKGRDFSVEQVRKAIADIIKIITMKQSRKSFLPGTNMGLFCEKLYEIKGMLSLDKREKLRMLDLHSNTESFVQHAMELSLTLLKCLPPLEHKSGSVVGSCRKLMRSLRELVKANEAYEHHTTSLEKKLKEALNEKCTAMNSTAQGAMASITQAAICLVTHTFKRMDEPLADLVDACTSPSSLMDDSAEKMREQKQAAKGKIEKLSNAFENHVSDLTTAGRFSASCCKHSSVYQKFSKILLSLDQATSAIIIAASEFLRDKTDDNKNELVRNDRIMDLKDRWIIILGDLIQVIVASLDLGSLLDVIKHEIEDGVENCIEAIVNMDESRLASNLQKANGKSRFLSRVANSIVTCSTDPVYRNGVLSHVKTLKQCIANCVGRGNELIDDIGRAEEQQLFTTAATNLLKSVTAVSEAILSDGNHPDLTSPSRRNVRDGDTDDSNAVLREMRTLNERLTDLGFDLITDEEAEVSYPIPSSKEPGWPRYFYKDDQHAQNQERFGSWAPNTSQPLELSHDAPQDLESLPGKIHPVIENLMQSLKEAHGRKSAKYIGLENAKEQVMKASETCSNIVEDALLQSSISKPRDEDHTAVQKASIRVTTLKDLILKEVDELMSTESKQLDVETLNVLALQWSRAVQIISIGCTRILPLHIVPVRRYLALSLEEDVDDVHNLARYIVSYPGSPANFVKKLASFKDGSQDKDKPSIGDFRVHDQNVKELVQLVDAINGLLKTKDKNGEEEKDSESNQGEIIAQCDTVWSDWSRACKTKEEMLTFVAKLSPEEDEPVDKAMLQLHCLTWAAKVHRLQCDVLKAARFILNFFSIRIEDFSLYDIIMCANMEKTTSETKYYKKQIADFISEQRKSIQSAKMGGDALVSTWDDNLQITSNVMEEILNHLSGVRSSVPLVFHHGHSMYHFIYLHHLLFLILSYLNLTLQQKENQVLMEGSEHEQRPSLSARLKQLQVERESRDGPLNDLLVGVPNLGE